MERGLTYSEHICNYINEDLSRNIDNYTSFSPEDESIREIEIQHKGLRLNIQLPDTTAAGYCVYETEITESGDLKLVSKMLLPHKYHFNLGSFIISNDNISVLKDLITNFLKSFPFIHKITVTDRIDMQHEPIMIILFYSHSQEANDLKDDILKGMQGIIDRYLINCNNVVQSLDWSNRRLVSSTGSESIKLQDPIFHSADTWRDAVWDNNSAFDPNNGNTVAETKLIVEKKKTSYTGMTLKQRVNFQIKRSRIIKKRTLLDFLYESTVKFLA
jgi:hypothetical protein